MKKEIVIAGIATVIGVVSGVGSFLIVQRITADTITETPKVASNSDITITREEKNNATPVVIDHTTSRKSRLLKEMQRFETEKQYSYAIAALKKISQDLNTSDIISIIDRHEQKLNELSHMTQRKSCSCFVFPYQYRDSKKRNYLSFNYEDFLQSTYQPVQRLTYYQRVLVDEKVGNLPLLAKEDIEATVESYEYIKNSSIILGEQLIKLALNQPFHGQDVMNKYENHKNRTKQDFVDFISYSVISPRLWHVTKLATLVNYEFFCPKEVQRRIAQQMSMLLARGMHKDWLNYANSDVQTHFVYVWNDVKRIMSNGVFAQMEILTTLYESLDKSKKRGADAWWKQ